MKETEESKREERHGLRRVLDVVLLLVFVLLIASLLGSKALLKAGVEFPEWTGIGSEISYLEGTTFQPTPEFSLSSYKDGGFQEQMRMWTTQQLPFRERMLVAHASMERACIGVANTLFSYPCYPSRYAHNVLYVPEYDAFTGFPMEYSEENEENLLRFIDEANEFATLHPETQFAVLLVGADQYQVFNPAYELCSNPFTYDMVVELAESRETADNLHLVFSQYSSIDEYLGDLYRTDHHWNKYGAIKAYDDVMEAVGFPTCDTSGVYSPFEWSGSRARCSLADMFEPFYTINFGDEDDIMDEDDAEYADESGWKRKYGAYDMDQKVVENTDNDFSAVLYGDSFMEAFVDLASASFGDFESSGALQWQTKNSTHIQDVFERKTPDVVMFVAQPGDYMSFPERNPEFFFMQEE